MEAKKFSVKCAPVTLVVLLLSLQFWVLPVNAVTVESSARPKPMPSDRPSTPTSNIAKFVWAAAGDSFASGEGNPEKGVSDHGESHISPIKIDDFAGLRWGNDSSIWIPHDPSPSATHQPVRASDLPASRRNTLLANDLFTCHRSDNAGAPIAHRRLKHLYPGVGMTLLFVACSGAQTKHLWKEPYSGPGDLATASYRGHRRTKQPIQLREIERVVKNKAKGPGPLDVLYMSIGGNDIKMGSVLGDCLSPFSPALLDLDCTQRWRPAGNLQVSLNKLNDQLYPALSANIKARFGSHLPVLISEYPNPLEKSDGTACVGSDYDSFGDVGFGRPDDFIRNNVSFDEASIPFSFVNGINTVIDSVAGLSSVNWQVIPPPYTGHGMCTSHAYNNLNSRALRHQGNDHPAVPVLPGAFPLSNGIIHPNNKGFKSYATAIVTALKPIIDAKLLPGLLPPKNLRVSGATLKSTVRLAWDDMATAESSYDIEVRPARAEDLSRMVYPDAVTKLSDGGYIQRVLGRDVQKYVHQPLPGSGGLFVYRVRACSVAEAGGVCGEFSAEMPGANFIPEIPSGLNGTLKKVGKQFEVHLEWNPQVGAIEYVLRIPSGPEGTIFRLPSKSRNLRFTTAVRSAEVAACNRAGCSIYSAKESW